jgi:hypothetical protein
LKERDEMCQDDEADFEKDVETDVHKKDFDDGRDDMSASDRDLHETEIGPNMNDRRE